MRRAKSIALQAINHQGVERYNAGDIQGCVNVYANCVANILDLDQIPKEARKTLTNGLQECSNSNGDIDTQAWALRGALDKFINFNATTTSNTSNTSNISNTSNTSNTSSAAATITTLSFLDQLPATFQTVNDGVMGGCSSSTIQHNQNQSAAIFSGNLSTANNGGFASVRAVVRFDLTNANCIRITAASTSGGVYKLRLRNTVQRDAISYSHDFNVGNDGQYQTIDLPLNNFKATWRGRPQNGTLDRKNVSSIGIMLVSSKLGSDASKSEGGIREGKFQLAIREIKGV